MPTLLEGYDLFIEKAQAAESAVLGIVAAHDDLRNIRPPSIENAAHGAPCAGCQKKAGEAPSSVPRVNGSLPILGPDEQPINKSTGFSVNKSADCSQPPYPAPPGYEWAQSNVNPCFWQMLRQTVGGPSGAGGTGGAFGAGGHVQLNYGVSQTPNYRAQPRGRATFTDPSKIELVSLDGTLRTTLGFILACLRAKTCEKKRIEIPGTTLPIEVYDLTVALADARAIFPTAQINNPLTSSSGSGGSGGRSRDLGATSGGSVPPATGGSAPTVVTGPGKSAAINVTVEPATRPTPGETAIIKIMKSVDARLAAIASSQPKGNHALQFGGKKL